MVLAFFDNSENCILLTNIFTSTNVRNGSYLGMYLPLENFMFCSALLHTIGCSYNILLCYKLCATFYLLIFVTRNTLQVSGPARHLLDKTLLTVVTVYLQYYIH